MALTAKQEAFSQAIAEGCDPSDAYRYAYDAGAMQPATIANNAYKLLQRNDIATMISGLKQAVIDKLVAVRAWDLDRLVDEAETNMTGAREDGQWSAANGSLTIIGKATGLLVDKVDVNVNHSLKPGLTLEELESRIQRLNALEAGVVEGQAIVLDE